MSGNPITDAIVASREITINHRRAFGDTSKIPAIYLDNPSAFKDREKNLLHHFKAKHGHNIEIHEFEPELIESDHYSMPAAEIIFAYVKNNSSYNDETPSLIFVNNDASMNYCHKRFFAIKELMHLITASSDNVTSTIEDLDSLLDSLTNATSTETPAHQAENAAYFGAIEILLNKEAVEQFQIENPGISDDIAANQLASKYFLPKKMASYRLRNDAFFKSIYKTNEFKAWTLD